MSTRSDLTTRSDLPPTIGLLLAGGASTRMGGGDKTLSDIGGITLLDRVIERVAPQCESLLLNSNGDRFRWTSYAMPVITDGFPGQQGPLAGILAGLEWVKANHPNVEWILSASTDCPFLPKDLASRLYEARRGPRAPLAVARSRGRTHPVIALWHVSLGIDLRDALDQGVRKASAFVERHAYAMAEWPTAPFDPFFNVNTPDDLAEARRLAVMAGHF